MEASKPEECREGKPRVRRFARIALAAALLSLVLSIVASLGLYANCDTLSDEVERPHPILGVLGVNALYAGPLAICSAMVLGALAVLLGVLRPPRLKNVVVALLALLVGTLAWGVYAVALGRIDTNPFRHRAAVAPRLGPIIRRYIDEHEGSLPPAATWCEALSSLDPNAAGYLAYVTYPMVRGEPNGLSWLALNANLDGDSLAALADDVVLLFETEPAINPVGGPEQLTSYARGKRGVLVVFGDLHVGFVRSGELDDLRWVPAP
jgi:hypothetical protein